MSSSSESSLEEDEEEPEDELEDPEEPEEEEPDPAEEEAEVEARLGGIVNQPGVTLRVDPSPRGLWSSISWPGEARRTRSGSQKGPNPNPVFSLFTYRYTVYLPSPAGCVRAERKLLRRLCLCLSRHHWQKGSRGQEGKQRPWAGRGKDASGQTGRIVHFIQAAIRSVVIHGCNSFSAIPKISHN